MTRNIFAYMCVFYDKPPSKMEAPVGSALLGISLAMDGQSEAHMGEASVLEASLRAQTNGSNL